ncbi:hypothetical protein HWV62_34129 [Athelia sp. TMB]|nr:hypothetical protein HWV62_34129 [Athelia sp. TMB]
MLSPVEDYVPLLREEKDETDSSPSSHESVTTSNRRRHETISLFASLGLNVVLLLVIAYLAVRQSHSIEWKGARPVYTGISAIPKSAAALLPNRTEAYTGDEQHYIVELDVFHQLHCLNLIRKSIWPEHYPEVQEARYTPLEGGGAFDHVDHCLNAIRESLTCNADLTPVTWHWNERDQISKFDFDAIHTCVSWEAVHAWTAENTARIKFDSHHHVVDDLKFPDDPKA